VFAVFQCHPCLRACEAERKLVPFARWTKPVIRGEGLIFSFRFSSPPLAANNVTPSLLSALSAVQAHLVARKDTSLYVKARPKLKLFRTVSSLLIHVQAGSVRLQREDRTFRRLNSVPLLQ
ncbi:unnamed protein product, partial [Scytosiphon promiscuus]